jgi:4-amino-4-deoxy-L-arabinose transferase-like glycosyltransferase
MVARNLDRGSGFFRPQLDTGPFPNLFLVEPPVYQWLVVLVSRLSGIEIAASGRIVSAFATMFAGLGLYWLAHRREGLKVALWSLAAFAAFPLTLRYGRSFQPDALMLAAVVLGLACWDRFQANSHRVWLLSAWLLLAVGIAIKITAAFVLIPLVLTIIPRRRYTQIAAALLTVVPALLWYAWALYLLELGEGSRASADNRAIWLESIGLGGLLRWETLEPIARSLLVRAFTPLGTLLAVAGIIYAVRSRHRVQPLWWVWGLSGGLMLAMLASKLHHEYYWLMIAPVVAVAVGHCLERLTARKTWVGITVGCLLLTASAMHACSTWRTPPEYRDLVRASCLIDRTLPRESLVVSPEALLFAADRRGCRLELSDRSTRRAAGEWTGGSTVETPIELLEHYRAMGAEYFADLGARVPDLQREVLHDEVRRRYKVLIDLPEVMIADLRVSEMHLHAN